MPWNIRREGSQHCVHKESGELVPGGCHKTRAEAIAHMRALYVHVDESKDKKQ